MKLTYLSLFLNVVTLCGLLAVVWAVVLVSRDVGAFDARFQGKASVGSVDELRKAVEVQRQLSSAQRCRCQPEGADELEPGKMGARIIPNVRDASEEGLQLLKEVRADVKEFRKLFDDFEAGRAGLHVKGSFMRGEADITIKRQ